MLPGKSFLGALIAAPIPLTACADDPPTNPGLRAELLRMLECGGAVWS
ncbi:hypothetical protein [Nonomuraea sp. NPDC049709]